MTLRSLFATVALSATFALGCASGLPAVVSSSPEQVSVEFELEGSVTEAGEVAAEECGKHGRVAEFDNVDSVASPKSRIANFRCADPSGSDDEAGADDAEEMPEK